MAAYRDVSEAIVQLREVRASFAGPQWQGRAANAAAVRAANQLVGSASARLAGLVPMAPTQRASLERVRARLSALAQGYGSYHPGVDGNHAHELEEVLWQLRELIFADPSGQRYRAQIEASDYERHEKGESQRMRVHQQNPLVWLGLFMFLLLAARILLAG